MLAPLFYGAFRLATKYLQYPPFFLLFCLCFLVTTLGGIYVLHRNKKATDGFYDKSAILSPRPKCHFQWGAALIILSLALYGGLAVLLSTAWLKGDDFTSLNLNATAPYERIFRALDGYSYWVSRNGDFIIRVTGFAENRWPLWVLNPLVSLLIPYGLWRLTGKKDESIASPKGIAFFLFSFSLALLSCRVFGYWRNYWCWAASANYLWPATALLFFLSYYRKGYEVDGDGKKRLSSFLSSAGVFLLGMYVCSGCECLAVTVIPLLLVWLVCKLWQKKRVAWGCLMGILGSIWGGFFLFASPAIARRSADCAASRALDVGGMSYAEIVAFVQNLNQEKIALLMDETDIINLKGIPLWLHAYFLPWLAEEYGKCCLFTGTAFILLFALCLKRNDSRGRVLLGSLFFALLSCYAAVAYLGGAIPSSMSFLPPVFFLLAGCSFLYLRLPYKWLPQVALSLLSLATALSILVPAGMEAWEYKKYEQVRVQCIRNQKAQGNRDVVVPRLFPVPPQDELGLIGGSGGGFSPDPKEWPNSKAVDYYGIDTISQQ